MNNSKKVPDKFQGIMLQSQLFGCVADLRKSIPEENVESTDRAEAIVRAVYRRYLLAGSKKFMGNLWD